MQQFVPQFSVKLLPLCPNNHECTHDYFKTGTFLLSTFWLRIQFSISYVVTIERGIVRLKYLSRYVGSGSVLRNTNTKSYKKQPTMVQTRRPTTANPMFPSSILRA